MRFISRKHRRPPTVIIVSLIDILIVLLIFMMVTTTFKQHPAVRLVLPEARTPTEGATEDHIVVTVAAQPPHFYLGQQQVTLDQLTAELISRAAKDPNAALIIRADTAAPWGKVVNVMDAARAAKIKNVSARIKPAGQQ
ncbi:MAG: biopolymer transporter ExbD [Verrucomicrobiae bacterium]|nr:biopolymer transporter ExbD [Verrucomicrobiae bacterium]